MKRIITVLPLLACFVSAQTLQKRIENILRTAPAAQRAFWGIKVVDAANGRVQASINSNQFFKPASNTKLFTTSLALVRLGADYTFRTTVMAPRAPDAAGAIAGDLILAGGGDPSLSARTVPYQKGPITGNPLQPIEALADQVAARGVRRIDGDIVGDDTVYAWEPYAHGWPADDTLWLYGAPISALTVNDNSVSVKLNYAQPGDIRPAVTLSPALEFWSIDNRVRPGEKKITVERTRGELRISGTMPAAGGELALAIDDPAEYAAYALRDALIRRGIVVRGNAAARHRPTRDAPAPVPGVELARRTSPPLIELLRIIDKVSQNLHAEMVLREVARVRRGTGNREDGIEERKIFLAEAGIPDTEYNLADGSGLSSLNLVTPAAIVRLLTYMYATPYREAWISLLPIGAEDGTLEDRFSANPTARRIHAKTGTITSVSALSGYAERTGGRRLAFSILVNNYYPAATREIRGVIDRIALLLTE